eukprot:gb/GEZN01002632.1/.p1 GENE.gb/GEZN01002632.1/~~gb/GEZN01002632.1/.p1  ORF type:complete len:721 (+),score=40.43 gb/GEZN01002632.1/:182-2344(+)
MGTDHLDQDQRASYMFSVILLSLAFPLNVYLLCRIYFERRKLLALHLAMAWLLMADLAMILNYTIHHTESIITGRFLGGVQCQISGFLSLVCVVFSNLSSSAIAVVTKRSLGLQARAFSEQFRQNYLWLTLGMVTVGIVYATLLTSTGGVGNYRGLYCCMKDSGNAWLVWSGFFIFGTCAAVQARNYYDSYKYVTDQMKVAVGGNESKAHKTKYIGGIRRHALRMSCLFYIAWLPMMVGGLVAYAHGGAVTEKGEVFPRYVDILIVMCVKIVPLLDGLVISHSVNKALDHHQATKNTRAVARLGSNRNSVPGTPRGDEKRFVGESRLTVPQHPKMSCSRFTDVYFSNEDEGYRLPSPHSQPRHGSPSMDTTDLNYRTVTIDSSDRSVDLPNLISDEALRPSGVSRESSFPQLSHSLMPAETRNFTLSLPKFSHSLMLPDGLETSYAAGSPKSGMDDSANGPYSVGMMTEDLPAAKSDSQTGKTGNANANANAIQIIESGPRMPFGDSKKERHPPSDELQSNQSGKVPERHPSFSSQSEYIPMPRRARDSELRRSKGSSDDFQRNQITKVGNSNNSSIREYPSDDPQKNPNANTSSNSPSEYLPVLRRVGDSDQRRSKGSSDDFQRNQNSKDRNSNSSVREYPIDDSQRSQNAKAGNSSPVSSSPSEFLPAPRRARDSDQRRSKADAELRRVIPCAIEMVEDEPQHVGRTTDEEVEVSLAS